MERCSRCMEIVSEDYSTCPNCGYEKETTVEMIDQFKLGGILQNRYTMGLPLGRGGFGTTYIAWDNKLQRRVAIKEYLPKGMAIRESDGITLCPDDETKDVFLRGVEKTIEESRKLGRLTSLQSIVNVYDSFKENGTAYIVMEFLEGENLKEKILREEKISFEETKKIITPVLETLEEVHKQGTIHRDISPDNIFLCKDGRIKLLDFGSAGITEEADEKTRTIVLKRGYAPCEQYSSDGRQGTYTDIYAVCATIYKMLTGVTPAESLTRVFGEDKLQNISELVDIPETAAAAIMQGLAINPKDRIQSAGELLEKYSEAVEPDVKEKKNIKKIVISSVSVLLAAAVVGVAIPVSKKAAKSKQESTSVTETSVVTTTSSVAETVSETTEAVTLMDSNYFSALKAYLTDAASEQDVGSLEKLNVYLTDLNGDGIDELIYSGYWHPEIAVYDNGNFIPCNIDTEVYGGSLFPSGIDSGYFIDSEKGIVVIRYGAHTTGTVGYISSEAFKIEGTTAKSLWKLDFDPEPYWGNPEYSIETPEKASKTDKKFNEIYNVEYNKKVSGYNLVNYYDVYTSANEILSNAEHGKKGENSSETSTEDTTKSEKKVIYGYIKTKDQVSSVNMRKSPSKDSKVLKTLSNGTKVSIIDKSGEWYKVESNKITGYVLSDFISDSKPISFSTGEEKDGVYYNKWAGIKLNVPDEFMKVEYTSADGIGYSGDGFKRAVAYAGPDTSQDSFRLFENKNSEYSSIIGFFYFESDLDTVCDGLGFSSSDVKKLEPREFNGETYYYIRQSEQKGVFLTNTTYTDLFFRQIGNNTIIIIIQANSESELEELEKMIKKYK